MEPRPTPLGRAALASVVIGLLVAACMQAGPPETDGGEPFGGSPSADPGTGTADPAASFVPADPIACNLPGASPAQASPVEGPDAPPGGTLPPGVPPPPLVPPEALDELNRLAGFIGDLRAPTTAGEDDRGVIWIGERGLERLGSYMDRVMDNLEAFWQAVLANDGKACAWEEPARNWISGAGGGMGPCQRVRSDMRDPYYCGLAGPSGTTGVITIGERWMFEKVYQPLDRHAEFAVAAILAHEMGHHIQDVLGYLRDSNPRRCCGLLKLNIELHADCLGGVWAHSLYGRDEIDLPTMTQAVRAVEDFADTPTPSQRDVRTHGTAEERRTWYLAGFESGRVGACEGALRVEP